MAYVSHRLAQRYVISSDVTDLIRARLSSSIVSYVISPLQLINPPYREYHDSIGGISDILTGSKRDSEKASKEELGSEDSGRGPNLY